VSCVHQLISPEISTLCTNTCELTLERCSACNKTFQDHRWRVSGVVVNSRQRVETNNFSIAVWMMIDLIAAFVKRDPQENIPLETRGSAAIRQARVAVLLFPHILAECGWAVYDNLKTAMLDLVETRSIFSPQEESAALCVILETMTTMPALLEYEWILESVKTIVLRMGSQETYTNPIRRCVRELLNVMPQSLQNEFLPRFLCLDSPRGNATHEEVVNEESVLDDRFLLIKTSNRLVRVPLDEVTSRFPKLRKGITLNPEVLNRELSLPHWDGNILQSILDGNILHIGTIRGASAWPLDYLIQVKVTSMLLDLDDWNLGCLAEFDERKNFSNSPSIEKIQLLSWLVLIREVERLVY